MEQTRQEKKMKIKRNGWKFKVGGSWKGWKSEEAKMRG